MCGPVPPPARGRIPTGLEQGGLIRLFPAQAQVQAHCVQSGAGGELSGGEGGAQGCGSHGGLLGLLGVPT